MNMDNSDYNAQNTGEFIQEERETISVSCNWLQMSNGTISNMGMAHEQIHTPCHKPILVDAFRNNAITVNPINHVDGLYFVRLWDITHTMGYYTSRSTSNIREICMI